PRARGADAGSHRPYPGEGARAMAGLGHGAGEQELSQRLRRLYPAVNQAETPLPLLDPRTSTTHGLSQGTLNEGVTWVINH
uniref:Uncharacterized protein n=1 Tax=Chelonoidis abingdonii TaxID=106734 RepID=A0A8C0GCL2_CHEAB